MGPTSKGRGGDMGRGGKGVTEGRGGEGEGGDGKGREDTPNILLHPQFQFSRNMPDRQTDRQTDETEERIYKQISSTAKTTLTHSVARQKNPLQSQ